MDAQPPDGAASLPKMMEAGDGRIVTMPSVTAQHGVACSAIPPPPPPCSRLWSACGNHYLPVDKSDGDNDLALGVPVLDVGVRRGGLFERIGRLNAGLVRA